MITYIESRLKDAQLALTSLLANTESLANIETAGYMLIKVFTGNGHVYSCGNGGSICDAMHFAEELTGRYRRVHQLGFLISSQRAAVGNAG